MHLYPILRSPTLLLLAATLAASESATAPITVQVTAESIRPADPQAAAAARSVAATPGGAAIVEGETILKGRTSTWRDLLQTTPGVIVQPRFGSDEARLSIRGSGIQRTFHMRGISILQDGIPVNQADGGGDFQAADPALADRVEVFRGGNALQYGASNLGGAINVVSPNGRSQPGARVRAEAGSFGYVKGVVSAGFANGDLDGWVGGSVSQQDGYREHSAQENQRVFANLGWRFGELFENRLFASYSNSDSELPGSLTKTQLEDDPEQANPTNVLRDQKRDYPLYRIADRFTIASGERQLDLGLGYTRKELFHPIFALIEQDSDDLAGSLRYVDLTPIAGRGSRITVGANLLWGRTDARQSGYLGASGHRRGALQSQAEQTAQDLQVYGEAQHEVASRWWIIGGVQVLSATREFSDEFLSNGDQSDEQTWNEVNPKLGVRWDAIQGDNASVQVFANVSRSAEPPTFAEYVQRDTSGQTRPQQGMEAQTAWTYELGTRGRNQRLSWDVTSYYAQVENELIAYQIAPGLNQTTNAENTLHYGIEAGLDVVAVEGLFAKDDRLVVAQVYNWGHFSFDNDPVYGDNQLAGLPEHTWRGELRWELEAWYAGPVFEWQDGWPVNYQNTLEADSSFLIGARAGYRADRGFSAFIEGRNLTDETYAATTGVSNSTAPNQALYNPGDGLSLVAGAEWRW